jgi:CheY-like chemotaxis protein
VASGVGAAAPHFWPQRSETMSRVLIAEDSPTQAQQLRLLLEDAGHKVELVRNGVEALAAIERKAPDVVVTDLEMPEMNGLTLVERVRGKYPAIPVILMTAFGSEDIAALALQKGATSYVPKRYLAQDIVSSLNDVLSVAKAARQVENVRDLLTETDYHFAMDNDAVHIPTVIGYLEESITQMRLCDQTGLIRVCVALREALINAMHHGNLEVPSQLKEQHDKGYDDMVQQRRNQEPYGDRRVYLTAKISRKQAQFSVRDEGSGYDPANLPDPTDPSNLEKVSGRGLLLIRTFMDHVHHNDAGNEITMVKRSDFPA